MPTVDVMGARNGGVYVDVHYYSIKGRMEQTPKKKNI